ncbi:MAG TPA: riboflavin synthase [Alphaproteobacteria bacterium]|nr:riboflavin synthase [Alphaproteobacteria bacterium]
MFTGIITDVGRVAALDVAAGLTVLTVESAWDTGDIALGASIAHNGVCLTVTDKGPNRWTVAASAETIAKTTLGDWRVGTPLNLERSLKLGDELGGHLVYGHVDGTARVVERRQDGESVRFAFEAPAEFARFIAAKGSVALDGVSLTVNEVQATRFGVNIIPHTLQWTTFKHVKPGDRVNLEVDMLARYVARLSTPV